MIIETPRMTLNELKAFVTLRKRIYENTEFNEYKEALKRDFGITFKEKPIFKEDEIIVELTYINPEGIMCKEPINNYKGIRYTFKEGDCHCVGAPFYN
tara:strand:+ start:424 stop:717 length:294 start_codon:yes stop_codon:yes gene_type:complete